MNNYYHINTHLNEISQLNIVNNSYIQNIMNDNFENRDYIPYQKINKKIK